MGRGIFWSLSKVKRYLIQVHIFILEINHTCPLSMFLKPSRIRGRKEKVYGIKFVLRLSFRFRLPRRISNWIDIRTVISVEGFTIGWQWDHFWNVATLRGSCSWGQFIVLLRGGGGGGFLRCGVQKVAMTWAASETQSGK